jgi:hypothetical protein
MDFPAILIAFPYPVQQRKQNGSQIGDAVVARAAESS